MIKNFRIISILFITILMVHPIGRTQPGGLGKLKKKVQKNPGKTDKEENPSKKTSPADSEIRAFKTDLKRAKEDVAKKNPQVKASLNKLDRILTEIKEKDAGHEKIPEMEQELIDLWVDYELFMEEKGWKDHFKNMERYFRGLGSVHTAHDYLRKYSDSLDYNQYQIDKTAYIEKFNDPEYAYLKKLDTYYAEGFESKYMPVFIEDVRKEMAEADRLYKTKAPYMIAKLDKSIPIIEGCASIAPKNQKINGLRTDMYSLQDKIQKYIDSGEYSKHMAALKQDKIDKVRMEKPLMTNSSVNKVVADGMDKNHYGSPIRFVITNSAWQVKKNSLGIPLNKYLFVQVATSKDGKCFLHYGWVRRDYNGGGYSNMYWDGSKYLEEMNCDNVNK